jgi:hypothetical protein
MCDPLLGVSLHNSYAKELRCVRSAKKIPVCSFKRHMAEKFVRCDSSEAPQMGNHWLSNRLLPRLKAQLALRVVTCTAVAKVLGLHLSPLFLHCAAPRGTACAGLTAFPCTIRSDTMGERNNNTE